MPVNGKQKGKRGELEFAALVTAHLTPARRGQQFCGANGDPDVICEGIPVHFEVKRSERLNIHSAMARAVQDAASRENAVTGLTEPLNGKSRITPVVAHRRNRGEWLCTLRAEDLLPLLRALVGES